jgi:hypothetical protein
MKSLIVAFALTTVGATGVSAQLVPWSYDKFPYEERFHKVCLEKAHHLYDLKKLWRPTVNERAAISNLEYDLDITCKRYRWRG